MKFIVKNSMVKYDGEIYREGDTLEAPSMPEGLEEYLTPAQKPSTEEPKQQPKQEHKK